MAPAASPAGSRPTVGSQGQTFFVYGAVASGERFSISADRTEVSVGVHGHKWGVRNLGLGNGWHHVAITYAAGGQSNTFKIYVDGELRTARSLAGSTRAVDTGADVAYLGRNVSGAKFYGGAIDDVRVYDYQLSTQEVLDLSEGK